MNLFEKADRLFCTPAQRKAWVVLAFCLLLFWQSFWNCLICWKLMNLTDYESLLSLQSGLQGYSSAWIVNLVMKLTTLPSFSASGIIKSVFSCLTLSQIIFVVLGVLLTGSKGGRTFKILIWVLLCALAGVVIVFAAIGLGASSLNVVIQALKWLGWLAGILSLCLCLVSVTLFGWNVPVIGECRKEN